MRLLELAKDKFRSDWTDADETLFRQTGSGEVADYGRGDPGEADTWGANRVLRADRIVWLCTDREAVKEVTHKGVQIKGARIEEQIILTFAKIAFPLSIANSAIRKGINVVDTHLSVLGLSGTHTGLVTADGLTVEHGFFMDGGFQAIGGVRLVGAKIGADLVCKEGFFSNTNPKEWALLADGIQVEGSVFLDEEFQAVGEVRFVGATVGRYFQCGKVKAPQQCTLRLESAKIGTLWDEEASWPAKLSLDGLVYDRLDSSAPLGWKERLEWLRLQDSGKFLPQPYVQLANVLQEMGHEADARKILIEKQKDPARVKKLTIPQLGWHHVLGLTIGYGYRPWQALLWMLLLIAFGWVMFGIGFHDGVFEETGAYAPTFSTFVYSVDAFVPLVDLHQARYRLPTGWFLRTYHWVHISAGWVLTTLLVVGLTGLVRK